MESGITKITDPSRIASYLSDESAAFKGKADIVYLPANEAELVDIVHKANENKTLLTISGAGTSLTGSRVPTLGGAVVSIEKMTSVAREEKSFEKVTAGECTILVDKVAKRAIVPPGIRLCDLDKMLAPLGLLYPPDPTEMTAMIGGTVATNASGARSFRFGPTRNWVMGMRVVLPTGEVAELKRGGARRNIDTLPIKTVEREISIKLPDPDNYRMPNTKNAAGLFIKKDMEPIDLFIGCEGLLGIISEIEILLVDRIEHTLSVIVFFGKREDALAFVEKSSSPSCEFHFLSLEYFDHRALDFMRGKYPGIPHEKAEAVLIEIPYKEEDKNTPYPKNYLMRHLEEFLVDHNSIANWAVPSARRENVRQFRHSLPELVNEYVRARVGKVAGDLAVPREKFREMMDAYEHECGGSGIRFLMFGHIGDNHIHLNFLPDDHESAKTAKVTYQKLVQKAVSLGGTITAEHGVGKKMIRDASGKEYPCLAAQYGESGMKAIAQVKRTLDPNLILNVGNMVPREMLVK